MEERQKIAYIKEVLRLKGIKAKWLADKVGISRSTMSNYLAGRYELSKENQMLVDQIIDKLK